MADQATSLPVRTEADGDDERLQAKIVDPTNPGSQQMTVDADNNAHVEAHGNDPAGVDVVLRTSELGSISVDGVYDASDNTDPSQVGITALVQNASPVDSQQTLRITGIANGAGDVRALDVGIRDEAGEPFTVSNPLPVELSEGAGDDICAFKTAASLAKDGSDTHTLTVNTGKTLNLRQILITGSGKIKVEIKTGTPASEATKAVFFNSTAKPNILWTVPPGIVEIAADDNVLVIITNRDNQAQDVYSTILGSET